jgi:DNA mismatch endonuclease, patch repair protein
MLVELGWRVAIVWECSLKESIEKSAGIVEEWLHGDDAKLVVG